MLSAYLPYSLWRRPAAIIMLVVYLLVSLSPLSAFALCSKHISHAVTRQCAGDCSVCGCSLESRAAGTCCCARKKAMEAHAHAGEDDDEPECCRKARGEETKKPAVVISCGCPCSNGKSTAVPGSSFSEIIPFAIFSARPADRQGTRCFASYDGRPLTRHVIPPVPPPEAAIS